jgi:alpha-glucosidase (family GH31 glycosyl hydrolase)
MQRQEKRPLIFHRWGGLGNHRYQIGFSGDYFIDWKGLAYQPEFTSTAANVGFGFWSHDIGGHMGFSKKNKQDAELFTRWVQWGAFSPIFRTHATADGEIERRIWKYPETNFIAMRSALQLRYSLIPYIYTYSRMAYDSGVSLIRPMYYEHPTEEKAYSVPHQYYFGSNMIVAPVYETMKGNSATTQTVWLPEGNWYDFTTHELITGGKDYTTTYSLNQIPVFIKDGSIIPTQTAKMRVTGSILDTLILTVYAENAAAFDLYEDEGTTEGYKRNEFSFTHFVYAKNSTGATFTIQPDGKQFNGMVTERCYKIKMPCDRKPSSVTSNGVNVIWSYDGEMKQLLIYLPKEKLEQITVNVN